MGSSCAPHVVHLGITSLKDNEVLSGKERKLVLRSHCLFSTTALKGAQKANNANPNH